MDRDVWTLLEVENKKIKSTSVALIDEGRILSDQLGGELNAIMFGQRVEGIEQMPETYGIKNIFVFCEESLEVYNPNAYARLLTDVVSQYKPYLFLAAASSLGSDLMPRVATKLKAPLVTNCVEIRVNENMEFIKPVQNGRLCATVICKTKATKIATINPNVLTVSEKMNPEHFANLVEIEAGTEENLDPIHVIGILKADHRTIDISEAEIIVAVGRGIGAKENFGMIQTFADRIQAAIGGTRPVIDAGILPFERQVGQTGKVVSPKLIIMCGISGAMEFMKGIENARTTIAINIDRQAPVFRSVDLGIIGDLNLLIPQMIARIDEGRNQSSKK
jgi:electron transfer flavoprotein alpha subunit